VPLSTQEYRTGDLNAGGNPAMDWHPIPGGIELLLVASCYGNRDKLRPDDPNADLPAKVGSTTSTPVHFIRESLKDLRLCSDVLTCLKGQCHAIWHLYKNLEGVFPSIEFQN